MKKTLVLFVLSIFVLLFAVGCQDFGDFADNRGNDAENELFNEDIKAPTNDSSDETNEYEEDSHPENGGENTEDNSQNPENGGNNGENGNQNPDNSENGGEGDNPPPNNSEDSTNPPSTDNGDDEKPPHTQEPEVTLPEIGTEVGYRFSDITLEKMNGGTISTADLRGKIVVVNVWASWCPPCKQELPDFDRIATEYKDSVVIIAADADAGYGEAKSYVDTNFPVTDIVFAYDTVYGDAYYAAGGWKYVPRTAIIDQNGIILYSGDGILTHSQLVSIIEANLDK